jgi:hypothetical protein
VCASCTSVCLRTSIPPHCSLRISKQCNHVRRPYDADDLSAKMIQFRPDWVYYFNLVVQLLSLSRMILWVLVLFYARCRLAILNWWYVIFATLPYTISNEGMAPLSDLLLSLHAFGHCTGSPHPAFCHTTNRRQWDAKRYREWKKTAATLEPEERKRSRYNLERYLLIETERHLLKDRCGARTPPPPY